MIRKVLILHCLSVLHSCFWFPYSDSMFLILSFPKVYPYSWLTFWTSTVQAHCQKQSWLPGLPAKGPWLLWQSVHLRHTGLATWHSLSLGLLPSHSESWDVDDSLSPWQSYIHTLPQSLPGCMESPLWRLLIGSHFVGGQPVTSEYHGRLPPHPVCELMLLFRVHPHSSVWYCTLVCGQLSPISFNTLLAVNACAWHVKSYSKLPFEIKIK
jgi:hypothetical protein